MNKVGNVPITILVLGIFVVCAFTLISFLVFEINSTDSFESIFLVEKMNLQIEDYLVYGDLENCDTTLNSQGNLVFYQELTDEEGFLFWKKEKVVFSIEAGVE